MKKFLVILGAAVFMLSLPACKKCSTCKYTFTNLGQTSTFTYPEQCGNKKDIEAYEDACKAGATLVGGSCTCNKD